MDVVVVVAVAAVVVPRVGDDGNMVFSYGLLKNVKDDGAFLLFFLLGDNVGISDADFDDITDFDEFDIVDLDLDKVIPLPGGGNLLSSTCAPLVTAVVVMFIALGKDDGDICFFIVIFLFFVSLEEANAHAGVFVIVAAVAVVVAAVVVAVAVAVVAVAVSPIL